MEQTGQTLYVQTRKSLGTGSDTAASDKKGNESPFFPSLAGGVDAVTR